LSEIETHWRKVFTKTWPVLMMGLGVLLMLYRE
jgi:hypothetical protein